MAGIAAGAWNIIEPMQTRNTLRIGDFDVEPSLNRLYKGREILTVEPKVMDLLMLLAESPGQVLGRDEILQRVWPETTVQDDALRRAMTLLRRALDDDPREPRYIETITRRGYRLVARVSRPAPKPIRLRRKEGTSAVGGHPATRRPQRRSGLAGTAWRHSQYPARSASSHQLTGP